jgi:probable HAF family extracellular repeat protein
MKTALALFASLLPALAIQAAPAPKWNIETLGSLGGGGTIAFGVNNRGEIVGYGHTANGQLRAFHWEAGTITNAGALHPAFGSALYAINDHGVGVGTGFGTEVAVWENGTWRSLNVAEGTPVDINKSGDVAGTRWAGSRALAYYYREGVRTDILPFTSEPFLSSSGTALNDHGMVVGSASLDWGVEHAFTWQNGVMTDLGTLGGTNSRANDVNNRGVVVGAASDSTQQTRAFVHDGVMRPVCGVGAGSEALGINDRGAIIGYVGLQGFLCDGGVLTILDDIPEVYAAGWRQMFPQDINERGWIVGWGFKVGGSSNGEAFVLTPK